MTKTRANGVSEGSGGGGDNNPWAFWPVLIVIIALDIITKVVAVYSLMPQHTPHEVLGEYLRLTLVYNRGAAFGMHVGEYSRFVFIALTIGALYLLGRLYKQTKDGEYLRVVSIAMVCAGAIGNLIDRLRSSQGVVDFIDVGIGTTRWPTFNVADIAVSTGAFVLAYVLWIEEKTAAKNNEHGQPDSAAGVTG